MNECLIISYNFPPYWTTGTIRVAKLVKYLPRFGWKPTVLTCKRRHIPPELSISMADYSGVEVIRLPFNVLDWVEGLKPFFKRLFRHKEVPASNVPSENPSAQPVPVFTDIYKLRFSSKLARFFLPIDVHCLWCPVAFAGAAWILMRRKNLRLVFISGPAFSQLYVGALLRSLFPRVRFIADFRDSWIEDFNKYYPTGLHAWFERSVERQVVQRADAVTVVADDFVPLFNRKYVLNGRLHLIHNGYDEDDFRDAPKAPRDPKVFQLNYVGGIGEGRNVSGLFRAIDNLKRTGQIHSEHFQINFYGSVYPYFLKEAEEMGITDIVRFHPRIPYREAIARMAEASVLLLVFEDDPNGGFYTTKFFEYLHARRPIFVIGPPRGAGLYIEKQGIGHCARETDVEAISRILLDYSSQFQKNQLPDHSLDVTQFSRENIGKRMAELFDTVCQR